MEGENVITKTTTNRGNPAIIYDGYLFWKQKVNKKDEVLWRCNVRSCKTSLKTDIDTTRVLVINTEHNHPASERKVERHEIRKQVQTLATASLNARPSTVIQQVLQKSREDNLERSDLKSLTMAAYRSRRKLMPCIPKSKQDVHESLPDFNTQTSKEESFVLYNDAETGIIIFSCNTNLQCLADVSDVFMDGTFKCCPKFFAQLYTVHGYNNGNYVPLLYMLLPGRSENVYRQAFEIIITKCSDSGLTFSPSVFHIDFESAVIKVVKQMFPNAQLQLCRFHLGQSWYRHIQEYHLAQDYKSKTPIGKWLHLTFGLHFLPPAQVGSAFADIIMHEMPENHENCTKYADYLTETYIDVDSTFPPHLWAEVPSVEKRTNNGPEAFHRHFNATIKTPHPNIGQFLDFILKLQTTTYIKIRWIDQPATMRREHREKMEAAVDTHARFQSGELDLRHYMAAMGHSFQAVTNL